MIRTLPPRRRPGPARRTSSSGLDGRTIYAADQINGGLWEIDPRSFPRARLPAHRCRGPRPVSEPQRPPTSTCPTGPTGSVSVVSFRTRQGGQGPGSSRCRPARIWAGCQPTAGTLWLSGRYNAGRVRHQHRHRPAAGGHQRGTGATRPMRMAPAGTTRWAHRDPSLTRRAVRAFTRDARVETAQPAARCELLPYRGSRSTLDPRTGPDRAGPGRPEPDRQARAVDRRRGQPSMSDWPDISAGCSIPSNSRTVGATSASTPPERKVGPAP